MTMPVTAEAGQHDSPGLSGRSPFRFLVREATEGDGKDLSALVNQSIVARGVRWTIDREDDFFAPFRAEVDGWSVLVAEAPDTSALVGCVSVAVRRLHVHGRITPTCYLSNLLVRPEWRGRGVGDRLCWRVAEICRSSSGEHGPVLMVIREGNAHMRGRISGPRGLPGLERFGRIEIHSISTRALSKKHEPSSLRIQRATHDDLEAMAALSQRVFPHRQFAPVFDPESLGRWIDGAPGLSLSDHLVAIEKGTVVGWLGLWNEAAFHRARVAGYSHVAAWRNGLHNVCARLTGAPQAPRVGDTVECNAVVHPCISDHRADILRAILGYAADRASAQGGPWLRIALDPGDPLSSAVTGLRTRVHSFGAHVTTPHGQYTGPALGDRPVHFEAATA